MISEESRKLLKELKHTNYGKALNELLEENYIELNNVQHCKTWEDTLGRAKALKVLDEIFAFMKDSFDTQNKTRYD